MQNPDFLDQYKTTLARAKRGIEVFRQVKMNTASLVQEDFVNQADLKSIYKKFPERLTCERYEYNHLSSIQISHLACVIDFYRIKDVENFPSFKPIIYSSKSVARLQPFNLVKFIKEYFLSKGEVFQLDFFYAWTHVMPVSFRKVDNVIKAFYFEPSSNTQNLDILRQALNILSSSTNYKFEIYGYSPDCSSLDTIKKTALQRSQYGCHSYALALLRKMAKMNSFELEEKFCSTELYDFTKLSPEFARFSQSRSQLENFMNSTGISVVHSHKSSKSIASVLDSETYLELEKDYINEQTVYVVNKRYNPILPKTLKYFEISVSILEKASTESEKISLLQRIQKQYCVTYDEKPIAFI